MRYDRPTRSTVLHYGIKHELKTLQLISSSLKGDLAASTAKVRVGRRQKGGGKTNKHEASIVDEAHRGMTTSTSRPEGCGRATVERTRVVAKAKLWQAM